jgi:molybdopterin-binding protein
MARYVKSLAASDQDSGRSSARNHLTGIVTGLVVDEVMAQVELQCGPYRVVSLMSSEAVRDLGLEVGSTASAVIKSTNVIIETRETT